jgi:hypothetical protein
MNRVKSLNWAVSFGVGHAPGGSCRVRPERGTADEEESSEESA